MYIFKDDPRWTREETDKLWQMCKTFDLRFHIIADRWEGSDKSMEVRDCCRMLGEALLAGFER